MKTQKLFDHSNNSIVSAVDEVAFIKRGAGEELIVFPKAVADARFSKITEEKQETRNREVVKQYDLEDGRRVEIMSNGAVSIVAKQEPAEKVAEPEKAEKEKA